MIQILGISGSLPVGSYNSMLLSGAARLIVRRAELDEASIQGIPLYDGDVEVVSLQAKGPAYQLLTPGP